MRAPAILALVPALGAGCLPYDPVERAAPPVDLPAAYRGSGGEETAHDQRARRDGWWEDFADPELSQLESAVLSGNLELRAAWARLAQAQALAEAAGAPQWPTVGLNVSASRQRQRFGAFDPQEFNAYQASLPVSYELDLFQRIGATATAAELDARAARDDVEALAMTLSATVAESWFQLLEVRQRRALLEEQLALNETFLELVELRFREGLASAVDVHQQRTQVAATRGQLELALAQRSVAENQVAILTGIAPAEGQLDPARLDLPETLPPIPAVGVPADLLLDRPDVRAARLRVSAADYRVGAAIADWFPRITLSGSLGLNSTSIAELFDTLLWSFVASLSQRIFDGGQRSAEIRRNEAVVAERLEVFGQTLLNATAEVDNALVQERQQERFLTELERQVEATENTLREARERYAQGITDFLPVLTAIGTLQSAQLNLLNARRQHLSFRVQLYRALGGSWTRSLAPPALREPEEDPNQNADPSAEEEEVDS